MVREFFETGDSAISPRLSRSCVAAPGVIPREARASRTRRGIEVYPERSRRAKRWSVSSLPSCYSAGRRYFTDAAVHCAPSDARESWRN